MANPKYAASDKPVPVSELVDTLSDGTKVKLRTPRMRGCDPRVLGSLLSSVEELSDAVADLEPDGKGVPVLLRQYLNYGGQILAFNVDHGFSDVVDGLVVVDIKKLSPFQIEKYLGSDGAARFLRYHESKKHLM